MMRSVLAHSADALRACRGGWEVDPLEKYQSGGCWNNQMGGRSRAVAVGMGGGDTRESSFCSQFVCLRTLHGGGEGQATWRVCEGAALRPPAKLGHRRRVVGKSESENECGFDC